MTRSLILAATLAPMLGGCALPVLLDDEAMEHLRGKTLMMYVGSVDEIQNECAKVGTGGLALRGCTVLQPTPQKARQALLNACAYPTGGIDAIIFSTPNETVIRHELHRATGLHRGYPAMLF